MTEHVQISELVGQWEGTNYLWLAPDEPVRVSPTRAPLELAAGGAFAELRYTWVEGGKTQEGLLLMRVSPQEGQAGMVWVDSWHMGDQFLFCQSLSGGVGRSTPWVITPPRKDPTGVGASRWWRNRRRRSCCA